MTTITTEPQTVIIDGAEYQMTFLENDVIEIAGNGDRIRVESPMHRLLMKQIGVTIERKFPQRIGACISDAHDRHYAIRIRGAGHARPWRTTMQPMGGRDLTWMDETMLRQYFGEDWVEVAS